MRGDDCRESATGGSERLGHLPPVISAPLRFPVRAPAAKIIVVTSR
jgi:hypothetical protein